jgi:hypothetical protein
VNAVWWLSNYHVAAKDVSRKNDPPYEHINYLAVKIIVITETEVLKEIEIDRWFLVFSFQFAIVNLLLKSLLHIEFQNEFKDSYFSS